MTLEPANYQEHDISEEEWREVETGGRTYRIANPQKLILRKGGSTHRVVDADGVVHCYAAPETGKSVVRWKSRPGTPHVRF